MEQVWGLKRQEDRWAQLESKPAEMDEVAQYFSSFSVYDVIVITGLHVLVISLVPVLLLGIFMSTRIATQLALYLTDSWRLRRLPRYKDRFGAWKMMWNTINWTNFCERMRKKDGSFHRMLNCGPSTEWRHWVAISDPDIVQSALTHAEPDEETSGLYSKLKVASPTFADAYNAWVGESILSSQGSRWHIHRRAATPLFFHTVLREQLEFISRSTFDMIRAIRTKDGSDNFSSPSKRASSHVMRCLLHLIAGQEALRDSKSTNTVDWMIEQQHNLTHHFRSSLQKTSFLGGRLWHILGGRLSNMLPWLGGEGNLHALEKQRYSIACYCQRLINRLRYEEEEEEDQSPSRSHDLLSMLFHLKLDEDFAINHQMGKNVSTPSTEPSSSSLTSAPHTPTPPLPSRRNHLLRRSHSSLRRSTASLVVTPPQSPKEGSADQQDASPRQSSPNPTPPLPKHLRQHKISKSEGYTTNSPDFSPLAAPAPYQTGSLHSKIKSFKVTSATTKTTDNPDEASPMKADGSTKSEIGSEGQISAQTPPNAPEAPHIPRITEGEENKDAEVVSGGASDDKGEGAKKEDEKIESEEDEESSGSESGEKEANENGSTQEEDEEDEKESVGGWETSSDGSAHEYDYASPEGLDSGAKVALTSDNWATMPYNTDRSDEMDEEDDPNNAPGSQPHRPGHLPDETIIDHAVAFLAAGFQPTTSTLEWCLYHLAKDSALLSELQDEAHLVLDGRIPNILSTPSPRSPPVSPSFLASSVASAPPLGRAGSGLGMGDRPLTAEQLSRLNKTRNFVKEVLRMHPAQPVVERILTDDVVIGGHKIPEGTAVGLMVWNLHRDPAYWKEPERFWPGRFENHRESTPDEKTPSHPFAFIPFSAGNHSCIAQKYTIQMLMITVSLLVRAFDMELDMSVPTEETFFDGVMSPTGLNVRFLPRNPAPSNHPLKTSDQAIMFTISRGSSLSIAGRAKKSASSEPPEPKPVTSAPVPSRRQKGLVHP